MIEVRHINKQYGSRQAVKDLNFSIHKGEVVGFLGPNGAGKTTTMRILTGCMAPTSGEVYIDKEDIFAHPLSVKKKIGYLPETPPIYGDMRVEEYLYYTVFLKNCNKKEASSLVHSAMEKTGLVQVKNRLIQNLSKGFKQRVGLAQALVSDPEILILDEPTIGLDPGQVIEIRNLIKQLKGQHTLILSTHILPEVQASCDRILIIREGQMAAQESLSSLKEKQYQGHRSITLRVRNKNTRLASLLKAVKGVTKIHTSPTGDIVLSVQADAGESINEEIAKKAIESGAGLMEITESFSLEDIFLQLTGKETS